MKHDYRLQPNGDAAARFASWLEGETVDSLKRSFGNGETTKSAIFLFANRAYEAHMPEKEIAAMFGRCVVKAGYRREEEEPAFAWLEHFGQVAAEVHREDDHRS